MDITIDGMVARWDSSERPLFKGRLIDENGCCCAQGDVLRCAGYTDEQLRLTTQDNADEVVARILGITLAESILLRWINDSKEGCPQDIFRNREKILGKHHKLWTAFVHHLDKLSKDNWKKIRSKDDPYFYAHAHAAAGRVAGRAAAARAAGRASAAGHAASAAGRAASGAAYELLGWSALDKPYFLCFFFDDPVAWVKEHE